MFDVDEIRALEPKARELLTGLSVEQINRRLAPGAWSIGECLAHLNTVNELYLSVIETAVESARDRQLFGAGPFRLSLLERWFVAAMEPPYRLKFKAPKAFVPNFNGDPESILVVWEQTHARLLACAGKTDGLHLTGIKVPSPASSRIKISLLAAFRLMAAHDRRHLWQAEQIKAKLHSS